VQPPDSKRGRGYTVTKLTEYRSQRNLVPGTARKAGRLGQGVRKAIAIIQTRCLLLPLAIGGIGLQNDLRVLSSHAFDLEASFLNQGIEFPRPSRAVAIDASAMARGIPLLVQDND